MTVLPGVSCCCVYRCECVLQCKAAELCTLQAGDGELATHVCWSCNSKWILVCAR